MAKVIPHASPQAGTNVHTSAHLAHPRTSPIERQQAIENALCMALHFVRQPGEVDANLWAATARTNRALTLLKQASAGVGATHLKSAFYAALDGTTGNPMGRA
jgi:hypothetical protein